MIEELLEQIDSPEKLRDLFTAIGNKVDNGDCGNFSDDMKDEILYFIGELEDLLVDE